MNASKFLVCTLISVLMVSLASPVLAQGTMTDKPPAGGPRRQLGTIIYAGLGGAVLGLSTLSFYGRPQDKLANIAIGFAVGVIAGTAAVTYSAATNPDDFYGTDATNADPEQYRVALLGPGTTADVLAVKSADASAPALSFSHSVFSF